MKNKNCFILVVLAAVLLFAQCRKEHSESEPNDSFVSANSVSIPCNIKGYLNSDNDVDF